SRERACAFLAVRNSIRNSNRLACERALPRIEWMRVERSIAVIEEISGFDVNGFGVGGDNLRGVRRIEFAGIDCSTLVGTREVEIMTAIGKEIRLSTTVAFLRLDGAGNRRGLASRGANAQQPFARSKHYDVFCVPCAAHQVGRFTNVAGDPTRYV